MSVKSIDDVAGIVCKHLPEGWEMRFCMENGAAWVELYNNNSLIVDLPDSADKTISDQINDAIAYSVGF